MNALEERKNASSANSARRSRPCYRLAGWQIEMETKENVDEEKKRAREPDRKLTTIELRPKVSINPVDVERRAFA